MGVFVAPPPLPLLTPEELQTYSGPLTEALKAAGPTERVFFSFPKPGGRYSEDRTAGALFVRGRYLHLVVTDHSSIGFEFCAADRPLVVFDAPGLIEAARINPDKVALLRSAATVVSSREKFLIPSRVSLVTCWPARTPDI